jgi:hypothetical protein
MSAALYAVNMVLMMFCFLFAWNYLMFSTDVGLPTREKLNSSSEKRVII